jgi:hypothetical protein
MKVALVRATRFAYLDKDGVRHSAERGQIVTLTDAAFKRGLAIHALLELTEEEAETLAADA